MALTPKDETHALQIQAGTLGRKSGHTFEDKITSSINQLVYPLVFEENFSSHVCRGEPACILLNYISSTLKKREIVSAVAISTGALATSEEGKKWLEINGVQVKRCKSDIIITLRFSDEPEERTFGISTKQCNNKNPTNAQLYFTTARGFVSLLNKNNIQVSDDALTALRQFCGDSGFRPLDNPEVMSTRTVDPRRFFWEEILEPGRLEWERLFSNKQDQITGLLLQKAYLDDPFSPDFLLHKTKEAPHWENTEIALYTIEEIISLSRSYAGFTVKPYSVRKGSYPDPKGITHLAPRFGIVQMQRGGQAQHPEQLQFNLEAGYFYKIENTRFNMICNNPSQ